MSSLGSIDVRRSCKTIFCHAGDHLVGYILVERRSLMKEYQLLTCDFCDVKHFAVLKIEGVPYLKEIRCS